MGFYSLSACHTVTDQMSTCVICCDPAIRRRCGEFRGCACTECVFHDPYWERYLAQGFRACPICSAEMISESSHLILVAEERHEAQRRERQEHGFIELENVFKILKIERPAPGLMRFVCAWALALSLASLGLLCHSIANEDLSAGVGIASSFGVVFATSDSFYEALNLWFVTDPELFLSVKTWMPPFVLLVTVILRATWYVFVVVLFIQHDLGGYAAIGLGMMLLRTWIGTLFLSALGCLYMWCIPSN